MKRRAKPKIDPYVADLCGGLRRRREELGLTLDELANRADLSPNYLGAIELGRRDPSIASIRAIADALRISVAQLFGLPQTLSSRALQLARLFDSSPKEQQAALLLVLYALPKPALPKSALPKPALK